jgi:hypothetical protein
MADLDGVHERLRGILKPHREGLSVTLDGPAGMTLETPGLEGKPWGYVAGTRLGKRYVSYYLMSVYGQPDLVDSMSPALRRRMQGKSCFNFTTIDEPLLAELAALTAKGIARQPEIVAAALAASPRRR